jgi:hypothetical protein
MATLAFVLVAAGSSTADRDRQPPRIVSAVVEDADRDSQPDRLRLTYSEPIKHRKDADGAYPFTVTGLRIASVGIPNGRTLLVALVEAPAPAAPSVRYVRTKAQPVEDRAGNQAAVQAFTKVQENLAATPPPPPPPPPPPASDRDGDGVPDTQDCGPADPAIKPGAADAPDLGFVDSNCDGIDGTETKAVFVSLQGKDTNAGTKAAPLRTLQAAIVQASQQSKDVYAAAGIYERVELADGVGVYGGYRADTWARGLTQVTGVSGGPEGVLGVNATGVTLQHLTVVGTGGGRNGASAYGIRLVGGSRVTLQRVIVQGGGGTGADPGAPGRTGADGGPGAPGTLGECDGKDPGRGGRGGASPGGRLGGRGGDGGTGDHFGATGSVGLVDTPGGIGGKGTGTPVSPGRRGNDGANGSTGLPGARGAGGTNSTALAGVTWQGQDGKPGTTGEPGDGGGGGGGGGGQGSAFVYDGTGNGGGGGGGGAAGGTGGGGGSAGGGSFGIYLFDSTVTVSQGSSVTSSRGGTGGNGGQGGAGGTGGDPGLGAVHCAKEVGAGGNGGVGGKGGVGGGGGGGAGGPSIGIFKGGASTALVAGSTVTAGSPGPGGQNGFGGEFDPYSPGRDGISAAIYPNS